LLYPLSYRGGCHYYSEFLGADEGGFEYCVKVGAEAFARAVILAMSLGFCEHRACP